MQVKRKFNRGKSPVLMVADRFGVEGMDEKEVRVDA